MKALTYCRRVLAAALWTAAAWGCVSNDLPYPTVTVNLAAVEGDGFTVKSLDPAERTVVLDVDETTDIRNVHIRSVEYNLVPHNTNIDLEEARTQVRSSVELNDQHFDMRAPLFVTLSLYQNYDWTIRAEQQIERAFRVEGQVGSPVFDLENRTATAYVAKEVDRSNVTIHELTLAPKSIATYSPTLEELTRMNFAESVRFVDVFCYGRTERWMVYILPTDLSVELKADAWARVIWLYGTGTAGRQMGFRYRKAGGEWQELTDIRQEGGSFTGHIDAEPETSYEITAFCGDEETPVKTVTTEAEQTLPNGGFEEWSTVKEIVYPYLEGADPYWSTGNVGAALVNETLTSPCEPRPGSAGRYAANLKSKFANVLGIGKFAAGNLFMGHYIANDGTNGLLTFGRSFTARPTALRVWVKYVNGPVNYVGKNTPPEVVKDQTPDNGMIYAAVGTWTKEEYGVAPASVPKYGGQTLGTDDSPICIATREISTLFKATGKDVVGYGELAISEPIPEWREIIIPIRYTATDRQPTHLLIVCAASRWGDYFTGSTQSEMWIDDFELLYNYVE